MYRIIIAAILSLTLMGCVNTAVVQEDALYFQHVVQSGTLSTVMRSVGYTSTENTIMTRALNQVDRFSDKYHFSDLDMILEMDGVELKDDYYELRESYAQIYTIVSRNSNKYDPDNIELLKKYHRVARRMDANIRSLITQGERITAVKTIATYSYNALQILSSMKP